MAGVDVLDPLYVPVDITVDVHLKAEATQTRVLEDVRKILRELLGFANQDFGKGVRVGEVYSALYPVEGVSYVLLKRLARSGQVSVAHDCDFADVMMGENEMAYEGLLTINLFGGS
jgi:hypothetical protein